MQVNVRICTYFISNYSPDCPLLYGCERYGGRKRLLHVLVKKMKKSANDNCPKAAVNHSLVPGLKQDSSNQPVIVLVTVHRDLIYLDVTGKRRMYLHQDLFKHIYWWVVVSFGCMYMYCALKELFFCTIINFIMYFYWMSKWRSGQYTCFSPRFDPSSIPVNNSGCV